MLLILVGIRRGTWCSHSGVVDAQGSPTLHQSMRWRGGFRALQGG